MCGRGQIISSNSRDFDLFLLMNYYKYKDIHQHLRYKYRSKFDTYLEKSLKKLVLVPTRTTNRRIKHKYYLHTNHLTLINVGHAF